MKELFFGFDDASRTLIVFSIVLWTFVLVPVFYQIMLPSSLNRLQKRPLYFDWRFWIPMLVYSILLGYRYDYSFDWDQYRNTFEYLTHGLVFRDDTEYGYMIINKLLGKCGFSFYSIFILEAIVYVTSYYFLFKDNRKYLLFVMPIVYMAQYSNCLNISRQFFAMSVLFVAYRNLLDGKRLLFVLLGLIACSIHSSAYLWLLPFFAFSKLDKIKVNCFYLLIVYISASILVYSFKNVIYDFLASLSFLYSVKENYGEGGIMSDRFLNDDMPLIMFLVRFMRSLMYLYMYKSQEYIGLFDSKPVVRNFVLIGLLTYPVVILMGTHEIFSRMLYYVSVMADIGWGVLAYNYFFYMIRKKIVLWEFILMVVGTFHFFWSYYSQIIAGFLNVVTNLFIIYK